MTYESLSLLLEYLLAAVPEKDTWDIAEAVASIITAGAAVALAVAAFVALGSWRSQAQYERRLNIAIDFVKGLHDVRMSFLGLKALTKDYLLQNPEDDGRTQSIDKIANEFAKPISVRVVEMRGIAVQADILGMPEFGDLTNSLFAISDKYLAVLQAVLLLRTSAPIDVAMEKLEKMIDDSGYFERLDLQEPDLVDQEIEKIEDKAQNLCSTHLKTRKAWYRRWRFWKTKKESPD